MRVVIRLYTPASEPNGPRVKLCEQRTFAVAAIAFLMMNLGFGVAAKPVVTLIEHGLTLLKEAL